MGVVDGRLIFHSRVSGVRVPTSVVWLLWVTTTTVLLSVIVQSASHNCPNEIREKSCRSGTTCT